MKRILVVLMSVGVVAGSATALAQVKEKKAEPKKTVLIFDDVAIDGTMSRPGIETVYTKPPAKFQNLIKTRGDFVREVERSVDNL